MWYLDDIRIHSGNTKAEDQATVEMVVQPFVEHDLTVNLLKSELHIHKTIFQLPVINKQEVIMYPSNLESIYQGHIHMQRRKYRYFKARFPSTSDLLLTMRLRQILL